RALRLCPVSADGSRKHPGYRVVEKDGHLLGMISRSNPLEHWLEAPAAASDGIDALRPSPIVAYDPIDVESIMTFPDGPCREAAERLAAPAPPRPPGAPPDAAGRLVGPGVIGGLLKARQRIVVEEARRERFFGIPGIAGDGVNA